MPDPADLDELTYRQIPCRECGAPVKMHRVIPDRADGFLCRECSAKEVEAYKGLRCAQCGLILKEQTIDGVKYLACPDLTGCGWRVEQAVVEYEAGRILRGAILHLRELAAKGQELEAQIAREP